MGRVGFEPTNPAMSRHIPNENCTRSDDSIGRKRSLEPPYVKPDHFIFNIANKEEFWIGFGRFLIKTNNPSSSRNRLNYARDYAHILQIGNASELLELSNDKRIHIMKSLSALAKYIGCYDKWRQIRQRFQLKWSNNDSVQAFASIFTNEKDLDHMIVWLKNACSTIPQDYANILIFNTLTGLRPSEACMAITLIHNNIEEYLNNNTQTLEHFRFPYFIRRTKKAYISILNDKIIEIAEHTEKKCLPIIRSNGYSSNMIFLYVCHFVAKYLPPFSEHKEYNKR